ncbi:hypothetical protein ACFU76_22550 [Streptomyces sp. NPDC057539]|uniref:hypothetical protein n=1 Tax=Streptomyces sp. NPDC057539 TaxID=3346159 RepID=UPI0036C1984F
MLIDMFGVRGTLMVPTADTRPNASPATPEATPEASPDAVPEEAELFQRIFGNPPSQ